MVNTNELMACMARKGHTICSLANEIKVSANTLSHWIKIGVFRTDYIDKICGVLDIKKPANIFFCSDKK